MQDDQGVKSAAWGGAKAPGHSAPPSPPWGASISTSNHHPSGLESQATGGPRRPAQSPQALERHTCPGGTPPDRKCTFGFERGLRDSPIPRCQPRHPLNYCGI